MSALLALVPWWERLVALLVLAVGLVGFGFVKGLNYQEAKDQKVFAKAAVEAVQIARTREAVTTQVVTKYLPQITKTEIITETITKEVPIYVPASAPDLPGGFRLLHDAAAKGIVPDPAGGADARPVPAQVAAATVTENYGSCRADQLRLAGLQEWINEQLKVRAASP